MSNWQQRYKPAAPAWAHLMLSALLWTAVGTGLALAGVCWVSRLPRVWAIVLIGGAALVGWFKAQVVLRRAAQRIAARIVARGDGRCLGGFLSWRTWLLVLVMIAAGRLLRSSPVPRVAVGTLYVAVGTALLLGSRWLWRAWRLARRTT